MPWYFIKYTLLFWVPSVLFLLVFFKRLSPSFRKAYWLTFGVMAVVSVVMEYFYLHFDTWSFSEEIDPLLGIWFWKAPIEEFVYWFGAILFCLSAYIVYSRLLKGGKHA
jgi:lycopene cyclase domain-containing protein